jgi:hypothetical protein
LRERNGPAIVAAKIIEKLDRLNILYKMMLIYTNVRCPESLSGSSPRHKARRVLARSGEL